MSGGMMYDQKDVVLIPFPYSDLTGAKRRPALIVSNGRLNETEDRICCLITSKKPDDGILVDDFDSGKLPFKSWVKPHRIFIIDRRIVVKRLCTVSGKFHDRVAQSVSEHIKR